MIKPVRTPNRSNIAPNNKEPIPWIIEKNDFKLAYVVDNDAFSFSEDVLFNNFSNKNGSIGD